MKVDKWKRQVIGTFPIGMDEKYGDCRPSVHNSSHPLEDVITWSSDTTRTGVILMTAGAPAPHVFPLSAISRVIRSKPEKFTYSGIKKKIK